MTTTSQAHSTTTASHASPAVPRTTAPGLGHDSFGDPYVTDILGRAIRKGTSARATFKMLGGKADSGSTGQQAGPVLGYDYPIKGTGNPDDVNDTKTIWWQICIGSGRVLSKQRGTMDNLPSFCPENFNSGP
jgi:hypothetical protein